MELVASDLRDNESADVSATLCSMRDPCSEDDEVDSQTLMWRRMIWLQGSQKPPSYGGCRGHPGG